MNDTPVGKHNPDVLSCLANLSSDEVFTPPRIVKQMLDMLPAELFSDKTATFLDPACKSGVFLREIARRLIEGLKDEIPDLQQRVDHIFKNQLYGIAITEMTSLLSRRSLYCSMSAESQYSVTSFDNSDGNVRYDTIEHDWRGGRCVFCGASQTEYDRPQDLETHAYEFIHIENPQEIFNMKFDVIIGNPPYQLSDGGHAASAVPIYHKFVQQAKKLQPRYLSMIIPARWYVGGRGLDDFRREMLDDNRIRVLHDFPNTSECFAGVEIKGGVCYFLWDRDNKGLCEVTTHAGGNAVSVTTRPLLEEGLNILVRYSEQISIYHKVKSHNELSFSDIVSANDPYGFDIREENSYKRVRAPYEMRPFPGSVMFYYNGWRKDGVGYVDKKYIRKGQELVDSIKIFVPRVWGSGMLNNDWVNPFVVGENTCSTETFLTVGPFQNHSHVENAISYMQTKFFHFMVSLVKNTQQAMQRVYSFVPMQDFSETWTDEKLYKKYGLTEDEIAFIESMIRPMNGNGGDDE